MAVKRVEGVQEAEFAYPEGTATVRFDTTATSAEAIIAELEKATGFRAVPRDPPTRPPSPQDR